MRPRVSILKQYFTITALIHIDVMAKDSISFGNQLANLQTSYFPLTGPIVFQPTNTPTHSGTRARQLGTRYQTPRNRLYILESIQLFNWPKTREPPKELTPPCLLWVNFPIHLPPSVPAPQVQSFISLHSSPTLSELQVTGVWLPFFQGRCAVSFHQKNL